MNLFDYCHTSRLDDDRFVGLKINNGCPEITFPRGYRLSSDEKQLRSDIIQLLLTLKKMSDRTDGERQHLTSDEVSFDFPLLSYIYVLRDYLSNGYYQEKEIVFQSESKGKVDWKKTIQKKQAIGSNSNPIYLDFIVRRNTTSDNQIITRIHEYCVYKVFNLIGWLFVSNNYMPKKPEIQFNKQLFSQALYDKLNDTFDDRKRQLFISMLEIIETSSNSTGIQNCCYGVNCFEYVWQNLIDYVFGIDNKDLYYPSSEWELLGECNCKNDNLEPDTIVRYKNKIYVLDAKYYKYGITGNPRDLPSTASIQKQLTYGKNIITNFHHNIQHDGVYNAFILPFESDSSTPYKFFGIAKSQWEDYSSDDENNYKYVVGILLDTKYIIDTYAKHNVSEIELITKLIEESLLDFLQ